MSKKTKQNENDMATFKTTINNSLAQIIVDSANTDQCIPLDVNVESRSTTSVKCENSTESIDIEQHVNSSNNTKNGDSADSIETIEQRVQRKIYVDSKPTSASKCDASSDSLKTLEQRIQHKIGVDSESTSPPEDGNCANSVKTLEQRIKHKIYVDSKPTSASKSDASSDSLKTAEQRNQHKISVDSKLTSPPEDGNSADSVKTLEQRIQHKMSFVSKSASPPEDGNSTNSVKALEQRIKLKVGVGSKLTAASENGDSDDSVKSLEQRIKHKVGVDSKLTSDSEDGDSAEKVDLVEQDLQRKTDEKGYTILSDFKVQSHDSPILHKMTSFESNHGTNVDSKLIKREPLRKTKIKDIENNIDVEACCLLDKKNSYAIEQDDESLSSYGTREGLPTAKPVDSVDSDDPIFSNVIEKDAPKKKGKLIITMVAVCIIVIVVVVAVTLTSGGKKNGKIIKASEPEQEAQLKGDKLNPKEVKATEMAVDWIENIDHFKLESEDDKAQRLALAKIYFATSGDNWKECSARNSSTFNATVIETEDYCKYIDRDGVHHVDGIRWLSNRSVCDWAYVKCGDSSSSNDDKVITAIIMHCEYNPEQVFFIL